MSAAEHVLEVARNDRRAVARQLERERHNLDKATTEKERRAQVHVIARRERELAETARHVERWEARA